MTYSKDLLGILTFSCVILNKAYRTMASDTNVLLSIPSARVFDVPENRLISSGELLFRLYPDIGLAGVAIGDYHFCISKERPISKGDTNVYLIADFETLIGVVLASSTELDKTQTFEALLEEYSLFKQPAVDDKSSFTLRLAIWLEATSEVMKQRLIDRSISAGLSLKGKGEEMKMKIERCEESRTVPIVVQSSTKSAKAATASLLQWLECTAIEAERASQLVGRQMSTLTQSNAQNFPQSSGAKRLASGTFRAFKKLIGAAKDSAVILTQSAHQTTVDLLHHKYGSHVSDVVAEGLESLGDLGQATLTLGRLELTNMAANLVQGLKKQREGVPM